MNDELVGTYAISLYPSQREKVNRYMIAYKIRKFSQALQRIIDDLEEPGQDGAEKQDTGNGEQAAGNIGA